MATRFSSAISNKRVSRIYFHIAKTLLKFVFVLLKFKLDNNKFKFQSLRKYDTTNIRMYQTFYIIVIDFHVTISQHEFPESKVNAKVIKRVLFISEIRRK